jgi:M6 family metalloprotease-like protein
MIRIVSFFMLTMMGLIASGHTAPQNAGEPKEPNLSDFRTVETAITAHIAEISSYASSTARTGYLGIHVVPDRRGQLVIAEIESDSAADRAGLQVGDVVNKIDGQSLKTVEELRQRLQSRWAGDRVKLSVSRGRKSQDVAVALAALSRPMKVGAQRVTLGVFVGEGDDNEGATVQRVLPGSPADRAGLKTGDVLLKVDNAAVSNATRLTDVLAERQPGDRVKLLLRREGKDIEAYAELTSDPNDRAPSAEPRALFRNSVYRLAVVCIEYPDAKHNPNIPTKEWEDALFSKGTYKDKNNATGQPVYGSLNDYYLEQSCGAFRVEGRVFDWIEVSRNRGDYSQGSGTGFASRTSLFAEALDKLLAREGNDALKNFDGLLFLYAGGRFPTNRGGIYWPHRSSVTYRGKRWAYYICPEGGSRMGNISVFCHEFGHMLGLPDLYARPENPGSEGLGNWCAMSNQVGNGRPQHFGAWCKEQLGWLKPTIIDPSLKQKLILSPVEGSNRECFKVLVRRDGSEYLLLENRRKTGFDQSIPAEGLLIWRVVVNRPMLEESHGVEGPAGPRVFAASVPYPSGANNALTPYTTPSSRSQMGGGLPIYITNIRRLPDGRISFYVGYEFD